MDFIYETFYQIDKSLDKDKGSKELGLSLCKTIIEEHRGTIPVKSSMGQGTRFSLLLHYSSSTI
ncbi:ATP-binding protein [Deltaproteobacteria bacterium]|nr:ATP-binding protein [Deltaproteobacteria bacterium]